MSADNGSCPKDSAVILRSNDAGWKSLSGVVGGRERVAYRGGRVWVATPLRDFQPTSFDLKITAESLGRDPLSADIS